MYACYGNPNKGDRRCHPHRKTNINPSFHPAHWFTILPTEEEASVWLTPGSPPWYYAQGLEPPKENTENGREEG